MSQFLTFDVGNSSVRTMLVTLQDGALTLQELGRTPNEAVFVRGTLYWDILSIWRGVLSGLAAWRRTGPAPIVSMALDTWAVDFVLLDEAGALLDNPVSNRDTRTDGIMGRLHAIIPREELYARTGIQMMQGNTIYQLYAMRLAGAPALRHAATFLTVADVLNYWLTGRQVVEFTSATATQFYDPRAGDWTRDLLERLDIPTRMLPEIVQPGTVLGPLDLGGGAAELPPVPVVAVASHDTGSAVAAVPAEEGARFAYISSGTWSLMGAEVLAPVITETSLRYNFTNEGGAAGTFRLLKNLLGMWPLQVCLEVWEAEERAYSWAEVLEMAAATPPFGPLLDLGPNSPDFRGPGDMPGRIRAFCARTDQPVPETKGAIVRCILESLALKYRQTLEQLEEVLGHRLDVIHIVGGGSRNTLLNQMTADATGRPVLAGPAEAATMGNVIVQAMTAGQVESLAAGRAIVRRSAPLAHYEPHPAAGWDRAYERFLTLAGP